MPGAAELAMVSDAAPLRTPLVQIGKVPVVPGLIPNPPLMARLPDNVTVRSALPTFHEIVRSADRTSELANFRSKAAPVDRMPKPEMAT